MCPPPVSPLQRLTGSRAVAFPIPPLEIETFMLFAFPTGVMGNVIDDGVNELILPNYKQTWADIRKIADAPEGAKRLTFKSQEYMSGWRWETGMRNLCSTG